VCLNPSSDFASAAVAVAFAEDPLMVMWLESEEQRL
jgi:hypothetical protein